MTTNPPSLPVPQMSDLTEAAYRALPGLSGTQVATLLESPARLKWEASNPRPRTDAMSLGTIFHALVLGGESLWTVAPFDNFLTKAAKEWKAEQEAFGLTVVKADVPDTAEAMAEAVMAHSTARGLLKAPGRSEVVVESTYRDQHMKGRIDRLLNQGPLVDLKSARDVNPHHMAVAMADYGYATQLAHYARIVGSDEPPLIVAVANTAPHFVAVYRLDALTWDLAQRAVDVAWDLYADCMESGEWPSGLPEGITELGLRPWAYDQLDERVNPDFYTEMEIG